MSDLVDAAATIFEPVAETASEVSDAAIGAATATFTAGAALEEAGPLADLGTGVSQTLGLTGDLADLVDGGAIAADVTTTAAEGASDFAGGADVLGSLDSISGAGGGMASSATDAIQNVGPLSESAALSPGAAAGQISQLDGTSGGLLNQQGNTGSLNMNVTTGQVTPDAVSATGAASPDLATPAAPPSPGATPTANATSFIQQDATPGNGLRTDGGTNYPSVTEQPDPMPSGGAAAPPAPSSATAPAIATSPAPATAPASSAPPPGTKGGLLNQAGDFIDKHGLLVGAAIGGLGQGIAAASTANAPADNAIKVNQQQQQNVADNYRIPAGTSGGLIRAGNPMPGLPAKPGGALPLPPSRAFDPAAYAAGTYEFDPTTRKIVFRHAK